MRIDEITRRDLLLYGVGSWLAFGAYLEAIGWKPRDERPIDIEKLKNATKQEVTTIQKFLADAGFRSDSGFRITVDGKVGPQTIKAATEFNELVKKYGSLSKAQTAIENLKKARAEKRTKDAEALVAKKSLPDLQKTLKNAEKQSDIARAYYDAENKTVHIIGYFDYLKSKDDARSKARAWARVKGIADAGSSGLVDYLHIRQYDTDLTFLGGVKVN